MASCDFKKLHTAQDVGAMLLHSEKESRMKTKHANKQLNLFLTALNWQTVDSREEAFQAYKNRIQELDETTNTNFRKDRVTCFGVEIPAPLGLKEENYQEFFESAIEILKKKFGEKNFIAGFIHVDEIHEYLDPVDGQTKDSRAHMHTYIVPEIGGKLLGKKFSNKSSMKSLNRQIDLMSRKKFGLNFMDGSKKKSTDSVEQLKSKSAAAKMKQIERMHKEALQELDQAQAFQIKLEEEEQRQEEEKAKIRQERAQIREERRQIQKEREQLENEKAQIQEEKQLLISERQQLDQEWNFLDQLKAQAQKFLKMIKDAYEEFKELKKEFQAELNRLNQQQEPDQLALETLAGIRYKSGGTALDRYNHKKQQQARERAEAEQKARETEQRAQKKQGSAEAQLEALLAAMHWKEEEEEKNKDHGFSL